MKRCRSGLISDPLTITRSNSAANAAPLASSYPHERLGKRLLSCIQQTCFRFGDVAREIAEECLFRQAAFIAMTMPALAGAWKSLCERKIVLPDIQGGDMAERGSRWLHSNLAHEYTGKRVTQ
jgi:hypothetical protein